MLGLRTQGATLAAPQSVTPASEPGSMNAVGSASGVDSPVKPGNDDAVFGMLRSNGFL
jgi:hypothetical protein